MNYARVKAGDLRFHVYERSIHPELFDIIRRVDVDEKSFHAELVISGQSHVISIRGGGETLVEVVAPSDASLPRIGAREVVQLGREGVEELRRDGAIRYTTSVRVSRYAPAEYRQVTGRLLAADSFQRIKAFFDYDPDGGSARSGELLPFALMDFAHAPRRLDVTSIHACPHELTIVRAETRVDVDER